MIHVTSGKCIKCSAAATVCVCCHIDEANENIVIVIFTDASFTQNSAPGAESLIDSLALRKSKPEATLLLSNLQDCHYDSTCSGGYFVLSLLSKKRRMT